MRKPRDSTSHPPRPAAPSFSHPAPVDYFKHRCGVRSFKSIRSIRRWRLPDAAQHTFSTAGRRPSGSVSSGAGPRERGRSATRLLKREAAYLRCPAPSEGWTVRDDVQAKLRSIIKRLLAKRGYPPEEQTDAIQKVIEQLETFADEWSPAADR
ncbi:type I restriction enzyme endonuclease domain-containing protein [Actinomadura livida]|uniref:Type I restriction enzyme HindI endonuclease subunit-like C-terminal domain-containing protein n=1 Tax=Actinomadura livida TaxID=79909 RepID=A0ABP3NIG6_9ACTN|nr:MULTISPECIES: type I restriction enzyme endonuclease domain-containing protein [Actinomadura]GGU02742.1 hypothetical protein GCM10010208_28570 [Actinomadura livida]